MNWHGKESHRKREIITGNDARCGSYEKEKLQEEIWRCMKLTYKGIKMP